MSELLELTDRIKEFRDARDWSRFHQPKDMALSLVLEAAELLEHFQWKDEAEVRRYVKTCKDQIADELSDIFYWVLLISQDLDIDLRQAFLKKMKDNEAKYPVDKSRGNSSKYSDLR